MKYNHVGRKGSFKNQYCYFCGTLFSHLTKEHLPFHALSPKAPHRTFAIIPSCKICNNVFSMLEQQFGRYVSISSSLQPSAQDAIANWVRDIERNPLKDGRSPRPLQEILDSMYYQIKEQHDGHIVAEFEGLQPPKQYELVLCKLALELHFHCTGRIIPKRYILLAELLTLKQLQQSFLLNEKTYDGHMGDFFSYAGYTPSHNLQSGIWLVSFYQTIYGYVGIFDPKVCEHFPSLPFLEKEKFLQYTRKGLSYPIDNIKEQITKQQANHSKIS
jgi:hypothetical protein